MQYRLQTAIFGVGILSLVLGTWCWATGWSKTGIHGRDIATSKTVVLSVDGKSSDVLGLSICIKGNVDGRASLTLPWDNVKLPIGPGDVHKCVEHDYYSNRAVLRYEPGTSSKGNLVIEYDFW